MEKTDVFVVLTNNTINAVTTDPNVADQIKSKNPNSVVRKYPMISALNNGVGIVGEALEGDIDMGMDGGGEQDSDDIEFVDGPPPADDMEDQDGEQQSDDGNPVDVVCMDVPLTIRMFEYVRETDGLQDEDLHSMVERLSALGNDTDDVLTMDHYDQIIGSDSDSDDYQGDGDNDEDDQNLDQHEFQDTDGDAGGMDDQDQELASDLEIGEDAYDDGMPNNSNYNSDFEGGMPDERGFEDPENAISDYEEDLIQQYTSGQISKDEFISALQDGGVEQYPVKISNRDPYGDDVSGEFDKGNYEDDELDEDVTPSGTQPAQQQNPTAFDGAYMAGYNAGKNGQQAQQQNINTPQGAAYAKGFAAAKSGQPAVPPSKQKMESYRRPVREGVARRATSAKKPALKRGTEFYVELDDEDEMYHVFDENGKSHGSYTDKGSADELAKRRNSTNKKYVREGIETFSAFLKKAEKQSPVSSTVSSLFKQKKQKAAEAETHFELEQDPKTSAVKIINK